MKDRQHPPIVNLLERCGIPTTEGTVLADLMTTGPTSGGVLARRLEIKRSTVYSSLTNLEQRGLVHRDQSTKIVTYVPADPGLIVESLRREAEQRAAHVALAATLLSEELPKIQRRSHLQVGNLRIRTAESGKGALVMLSDVLCSGDFRSFWDPESATSGAVGAIVLKFLEQTARTKPRIRDIAVSGPRLDWYRRRIRNPNHEIKEVPREAALQTDVILARDSVFLTNYAEGSQMAVEITQPQYYQTMCALFELLWERL